MKTYMRCAAVFLMVSAAVVIISVGRDLHELLTQTTATVQTLQAAARTINDTAQTVDGAAREEKANWQKTSLEAAKTGAAVRLLVSRLDRSLVDGTLNHVNTQTLPALDAQIQGNGAAMQRTLDTTTNVMGSLNAQIWNPKLGNSITQLSIASTQLAQASTHANKILGDGEKVADHYEKEILAPVSWYRKAAEYVLSFGADARVLFGGK